MNVRGTIDELEQRRDTVDDAYLRVFLVCERPRAGLGDQVRELLPNALEVRLEYERDESEAERVDMKTLTPRELFARYYLGHHAADAEKELLDLFDRLLDEVTTA
jgi:exonuclease SbcD